MQVMTRNLRKFRIGFVSVGVSVIVALGVAGEAVGSGTPTTAVRVMLPGRFAHSVWATWAVEDLSSAEVKEFPQWPTQLKVDYLTVATSEAWNPDSQPTPTEVHDTQAFFLKTESGFGVSKAAEMERLNAEGQ